MPDKEPGLDAAYALQSPEDNRRLYASWAASYDSGFAGEMGYLLPGHVAATLRRVFDGPGPVLDVGAGTGLVADALGAATPWDIDAIDISPDMLQVAAAKGVYRRTIEADLTQPLDLPAAAYGAVVSAGTFTHGHVGPEVLDALLHVTRPGGLFVLSINAAHFEGHGFAAKFDALSGAVEAMTHRLVDIYGNGAQDAHAADQAYITHFRKR